MPTPGAPDLGLARGSSLWGALPLWAAGRLRLGRRLHTLAGAHQNRGLQGSVQQRGISADSSAPAMQRSTS